MEEDGREATLLQPFKGYRNIELVEQCGDQWVVRLCGNGKEIMVYRDEFTIDNE